MHMCILWWVLLLGNVYVSFVRAVRWWEAAVVYQIYVRSFKDSNGDGIGDLNGITENMAYFKDTGVDAICLSPIYKSPKHNFDYDIIDYRQIAADIGTMTDFNNLIAKAKRMEIRVILDFVPNHTSDQNKWFIKSKSRDPEFDDYYIWSDGKRNPNGTTHLPPSNWVNVFNKSAWEFNTNRQQYYLHQFGISQPDLNYRNPRLRSEMKRILRFWLDMGVSGFCVHAVNSLVEVNPSDYGGYYPDEPLSNVILETSGDSAKSYLQHIYTKDLNENYGIIYEWRAVLDEYKKNEPKLILTDAYTDLDRIMRFYGDKNREGSIPLNFLYLESLTVNSNAWDIKMAIDQWMSYLPIGKTASWLNGNHDHCRLATRHGVHRVDAMNMLSLILPGVTVTYQGEEIGMTDGVLSWEKTRYPQAYRTAALARTPFHWDHTRNAGFTKGSKPWLPLADNYNSVNLKAQMYASKSHYKFYKDMVSVKHLAAVRSGYLQTKVVSNYTLVITRLLPGYQAIVGLINLSRYEKIINLSAAHLLPEDLKVIAAGVDCALKKGTLVGKSSISLSGHCALTLESKKICC